MPSSNGTSQFPELNISQTTPPYRPSSGSVRGLRPAVMASHIAVIKITLVAELELIRADESADRIVVNVGIFLMVI
jgi:hypothetical protein